MNILFITPRFYPHVGGVEKHVYELALRLISKDHKITIVTEEDLSSCEQNQQTRVDPANEVESLENATILRIPIRTSEKNKKFVIWKWLFKNRKIFEDADIIHVHDVFYWYLPFWFLNPFKKVYITFHGYESYPIPKRNILMRKIFENMAHGSICIGDFMKKWYHQHPTLTLYGGVSSVLTKPIKKQLRAIFIGRLDEHTGFSVYIEAFKKIRENIPSFQLTVYGDGSMRRLAEGTEGVTYKGFDFTAEKQFQYYQFAFVSRNLAILEALANKCHVIAHYDNPLKHDYLAMAPYAKYISVVNTADGISKEVFSLLRETPREDARIIQGYDFAKSQTWELVARTYEKLWGV